MKIKVDTEWLRHKYFDEGLSCQRISEILGNVTRQGVYLKLKRVGIKARSKRDAVFYADGNKCKISQGYFWIWMPEHPRSNGGYVKRSVLNLESKIGRFLRNGEMPHHKDENRMNDDPENLEITNRSKHAKIHGFGNN